MSSIPVSVTVGIPAYNEAANITYILREILAQNQDGFVLEKIVVNSDGSSDETVLLARSIGDHRIIVVENHDRKGQSVRQNEIIASTTSDILVLLNADIALDGRDFLGSLVHPIIAGGADFTSANMLPIKPDSFLEKVLAFSLDLKNLLFEDWRNGNNLYTCHGAARAFARSYYKHFRFSDSVGEDAYSYLFGATRNYRYQYVSQAVSRIKLPDTIADHLKQSRRFFHSQSRFSDIFGPTFVEREYAYPLGRALSKIVATGLRHPILFVSYLLLTTYSCLSSHIYRGATSNTWEIATSSKRLHP